MDGRIDPLISSGRRTFVGDLLCFILAIITGMIG
jgi:hypothetical protein